MARTCKAAAECSHYDEVKKGQHSFLPVVQVLRVFLQKDRQHLNSDARKIAQSTPAYRSTTMLMAATRISAAMSMITARS